jgi:RHS repeat-associated protein
MFDYIMLTKCSNARFLENSVWKGICKLSSQQQYPNQDWEQFTDDGLSNMRGIGDCATTPLESRTYSPFGEPAQTSQTPFGFTGEMTDPTGLVYLRERYYNPTLGVFLSPDPYQGSPTDPMSLNQYSYVQNNPVNMVDPSGFYSCKDEMSGPTTVPMASACQDVDQAFNRASGVGVSLTGDLSTTVNNGIVDFAAMQSYITSNFGFTIAGYNTKMPLTPITQCTEIENLVGKTNAPAKLSLVRSAAAMLHIAAKFKETGLGNGADTLRTAIGNGTVLQLVADAITLGTATGLTPLNNVPASNDVFLGSEIKMYAIVHELGHAFDRRHDLAPSSVMEGLRVRADNGLSLYIVPDKLSGIVSKVDSSAGMGGRANSDQEHREVWADMFMTWVLDGQGIQSLGQVAGLIGWTAGRLANAPQADFKRAYTTVAVRNLTVGGFAPFPHRGTVKDEDILAFLRLYVYPGVQMP